MTTQQTREATVNENAPAVVNPDGTPTEATIDMLQRNGRARSRSEASIKAKQIAERKASKAAAPSKPVAKTATRGKAPAKPVPIKKVTQRGADTTTKAERVRAEWMKNPDERPTNVAKATGVDPAYVWDIRQAMRRAGTLPMPKVAGAK